MLATDGFEWNHAKMGWAVNERRWVVNERHPWTWTASYEPIVSDEKHSWCMMYRPSEPASGTLCWISIQ